MKKSKNKKIVATILAGVTLCLCLSLAMLFHVVHEQQLEELQNAALAELEQNQGEYDDRSIVLYETSKQQAEELAALFDAHLRITKDGQFATLTLPEGVSIRDVYAREAARPYIESMSADYHVHISELEESRERLPARPTYTVTDAEYANQVYLDYLNMGSVWNSTTGSGVTVAVIDTGIDTDHPEFEGRISEYSYNATEDKVVKDFLLEDGSYDWSLIEDKQGHGTAVTGVIAASMNQGNIVGIAPNVTIITIKAECDENGEFERTSDLVFGMYYAIERDAQVINMSFGSNEENPFAAPVQLAYDSDIICVASAGNEKTSAPTYPAADPHVIGVGALAEGAWTLAEYSNFGENTDVVAPGSTYTTLIGGQYGTKTGTSLSSPIVTGMIALLMEDHRYITFDEVTSLLNASCYDLGHLGRDWDFGFGAVDMQAFLLGERGTVTFDMLTDELDNEEGLFIRGHALQELPTPDRLYAVFDGWYYDNTFTQEYQYYQDAFVGDLTLYAKWVNEEDGVPFTYVILEDGTVEIRSYTGHRRYITVPEKIDGRTVSAIGDFAFSEEEQLREVTLPSGLVRIGKYAFEKCANLLSIEIPAGVKTIGKSAFCDNTRLSTVAFRGTSELSIVEDFAFSNCVHLETIELPASLEKIDGSAFYGSLSLKSITVQNGNAALMSNDGVLFNATGSTVIAYPVAHGTTYALPETVQVIDRYAFAFAKLDEIDLQKVNTLREYAFSSSTLKTLVIPDSVTVMESKAFEYNRFLSLVTLGKGLKTLPSGAFSQCESLTSICIPASVQSIQNGAFANTGLEKLVFEENSSLTDIETGAFYGAAIREVDIPASVIRIGDKAFSGYIVGNPLTRVGFDRNSHLRIIGKEAFSKCFLLESIVLPQGLETIEDYAFFSSALPAITVPAGVTELGSGVFANCTVLTAITVAEENTVYHDLDGVVYSRDNTVIYAYPSGRTGDSYTPENTITTVAPWAFAYTPHLKTVSLPEGVTEIGNGGFLSAGITSMGLPESLKTIAEQAFSSCVNLTSIHIPDGVLQIGRLAFAFDWQLSSITFGKESQLPRIGHSAFAHTGLESFTVPASVSSIAQGAFTGCCNLKALTVSENSTLESISAHMFTGCDQLESIVFLPGSALTSIQAHGFEGLRSLTTLDLRNTKLTNIDNFAFRFCESLTTLTLPDTMVNVGRYAFYYCTSLPQLTLSQGIEHIGSFAFLGTADLELYFTAESLPLYLDENWDYGLRDYYTGVTGIESKGDYRYAILSSGGISILEYTGEDIKVDLTALNLGGPITAVGGGAFRNSSVTEILLPDTVTAIQAEAFAYSKLGHINIPAAVTFIGREAFAHTPLQTVAFAPNSQLRVIEQYAFTKTEALTTVALPASLQTMGTGVFKESGLSKVTFAEDILLSEIPQNAFEATKLTAVSLPDSVTLVNHNAFNNVTTLKSLSFGVNDGIQLMSNAFYHTGLESLHIPANVSFIGEYCFVALSDLDAFTVDSQNPYYTADNGLLLTKNGRKLIASPAGKEGSLTVPLSVEEIGFGAFEESRLSEIRFHSNANILSFGWRAFFKAENLTAMEVPASVVSIDYYAFAYCKNLKTVTFAPDTQLKGIHEGVFCGDVNLVDITLPDSIVEISDLAFYGCSSIRKLPIHDTATVKGIYDYAFAYSGLNGGLLLPETLNDIGNYAFLGTKMESVTVPDTNKKQLLMGFGVFEDCRQLTEMTLPFIGASYEDEELSWFGYIFGAGSAQANATYVPASLKTLTISEGLTTIGCGAFEGITTIEAIHLPHSVTALYSNAFKGTTATYELTNTIVTYAGGMDDLRLETEEGHFGIGLTGHVTLGSGIRAVNYHSFFNCTLLTGITLPVGTERIGLSAFFGCSSLRQVTIPDGVTTIESSAFHGCASLAQIHLPDSITTIETWAFANTAITDLTIPAGVTELPIWALSDCHQLTRLTIPANMTHISEQAFSSCEHLFEIHNHSDLPLQFGSESQGEVAKHARLIVEKDGSKRYLDEDSGYERIDTADGFRFIKEGDVYKLLAYLGTDDPVVLPNDINGVPYEIFRLNGIRNVILPEGMTAIGDGAFKECTTLESVVIPDTVKTIGNEAFYQCTALKSIRLPEGVTEIGEFAFYQCFSLKTVDLPDTLQTIKMYAFSTCSALTELAIPDNVSTIEPWAFYNTGLQRVVLPANLTVIENYLFHNSSGLRDVFIPQGVTTIKDSAFGNSDIQSIVLPDSITVLDAAFPFCDMLAEIVIPEGVTEITSYTFRGCTSLERVVLPESLTAIHGNAFFDCTSLSEITIPKQVTTLSPAAFTGCPIEHIYIADENPSFIVIDDVVYNRDVTAIVYTPSTVTEICVPATITDIEKAFVGAPNLETVTFASGSQLTQVSSRAFFGCKKLKTVKLPTGVTEIGSEAFFDCTQLETVELPDSVTTISWGAFRDCSNLKSINLPQNLTEIGWNAFLNCSSIEQISIPASVTALGDNAFGGCRFSSFTVDAQSPLFTTIDGVIYNQEVTEILHIPTEIKTYCVPATVTNIANLKLFELEHITFEENSALTELPYRVFEECQTLKTVVLPDSITELPGSAFQNCHNLVQVVLPDTVTYIGQWAFYGCYRLADLQLSDHITGFGNGAFQDCCNLTSFTVPKALKSIDSVAFLGCKFYQVQNNSDLILTPGSFSYEGICFYTKKLIDKEGEITYADDVTELTMIDTADGFRFMKENGVYKLIAYTGTLDTVTLPDDINGEPYVLYRFNGAERVIVPKSKTVIDAYAFQSSNTLKYIELPDTLEQIGEYAFDTCQKLTSLVIPDRVTQIGEGAFNSCTALEELVFPDGITEIHIESCSALRNITLPQGVTSVTIKYCSALTELQIPKSVSTLDLEGCSGLLELQIPKSIQKVNLSYCSSLTGVTIPDSITSIDSYAFRGCTSLAEVHLPVYLEHIGHEAFADTAYYNDPTNWDDGALYVGNHLIEVKDEVENLVCRRDLGQIAVNAFIGCQRLKTLSLAGNHWLELDGLTNLETLILTQVPDHPIGEYFCSGVPITLKTVVIAEGAWINNAAFNGLSGISIFVENTKNELRWEENYPGWNNENRVIYKDRWSWATFRDVSGNIIRKYPRLNVEIIRLPVCEIPADKHYTYEINGWDLDGDGIADPIPATSNVDIEAQPIITRHTRQYVVRFMDWTSGTVYHTQSLPYGAAIPLPSPPNKTGYDFAGWQNDYAGMTVTGTTDIYAIWNHIGSGHIWEDPQWIAPTCTEKGYNKHTCSVCGEWFGTDYVAELGHSYQQQTVPPTCTEDGYTLHQCERCKDSYKDSSVSATGHHWGNWTMDNRASCSEPGKQHRTCLDCPAHEETVLPAIGHHFIVETIQTATCSRNGIQLYTCEACDKTIRETTQTTPHNYQKKYVSKWWLEWLIERILNIFFGYEGSDPYYFECASCGHIQTKEENVSSGSGTSIKDVCDHEPEEWALISEAGCETYAVEGQICHLCRQIVSARTLSEPLGHDLTQHKAQAPTCTEIGWEAYETCSRCDYTTYKEIAATGHTMGEWIETTSPGCLSKGEERRNCDNCDHFETREVKELGHDLTQHKAQAPTCTEIGWEDYETCSRCDYTTYKEIVATGHTMGEWVETTAPGCLTKGEERRDCANCDHFETREVDALGHDLTQHKAQAPTCTEIGWQAYETCSRCDHTTYKEIVATGHSYVDAVVPPTETEQGYTEHVCSKCDDSYRDNYVDALPSTLGDVDSDNSITSTDARLVLQYYAGKIYAESLNVAVADVDGDGQVTSTDARLILQLYAGKIEKFPAAPSVDVALGADNRDETANTQSQTGLEATAKPVSKVDATKSEEYMFMDSHIWKNDKSFVLKTTA